MEKFLFSLFSLSFVISSYSALVIKAKLDEMNVFFDDQDYDVFDEVHEIPVIETELILKSKDSNERILRGNNCEYISVCDIAANSQCSDGKKFVIRKANGTRKQFLILNNKTVLGFITKDKKFTDCTEYSEITSDVTCKKVNGLDSVSLESETATSSNISQILNVTAIESAVSTDSSNATSSLDTSPSANIISVNSTTVSNVTSSTNLSSNSTSRSLEEILVIIRPQVEIKIQTYDGRKLKGEHCDFISICNITENSGCSNGYKFVVKQASGVKKKLMILNGKAVLGFVTKGEKFKKCTSYTDVTSSVTCKAVAGLGNVDLSAASDSSAANESSNETLSADVTPVVDAAVPSNGAESSNLSTSASNSTNDTSE